MKDEVSMKYEGELSMRYEVRFWGEVKNEM